MCSLFGALPLECLSSDHLYPFGIPLQVNIPS